MQSACRFTLDTDALGAYARINVDPGVYSEAAVLKTAYWFTDQYFLYLANSRDTKFIEVEIRLKIEDDPERLKTACGEFLNLILDQAVRQRVLEETANVRDTLLKKAFFEARLQLPSGVASNETLLPAAGQSYRDGSI